MAEDTAAALYAGAPIAAVVPQGNVDIATSLAPYIVLYNASGQPIAGNGTLDGSLPSLPTGIFNVVAMRGGEDRVTWQPKPAVRSAIVVVPTPGWSIHEQTASGTTSSGVSYVMAGRSLREVEIREDALTLQVGAVFFFALIGSFLLVTADVMWWSK